MKLPTILAAVLVAALVAGAAQAQDLADRVTEATLANGLRVLLVEQTAAPIIAFNLTFDVGAVDEPAGLGGIAHMVEHMAFKGTGSIGSLDREAEMAALAKLEVAALSLEWVRTHGDDEEIAAAEAYFAAARDAAQALALSSPLDELLSVNGAVGLNASTGLDRTSYVVSLPANRLELYARIYADVLLDTTFRYFYPERDVVREERRQRSEDDPQGFLFEAFLATAFPDHPYGRPTIGSAAEIEGYTATEAEAFFDTFYHPDRAVLVLVGDVDPARDLPILERYFGVLEPGPDLRPLPPPPTPQTAERRIEVPYDAEPQLVIGYHKPTYPDRDAYVLDLVDAILDAGRTSRLYQRMVLADQSALGVSTSSAFPGVRYENLFLFYGLPRAPFGTDDLESAFYDEIDRLAAEGVSDEELQKVKNQVRASVIRGLASGSGLAANLAFNELFGGGWERFEGDLEIYDSITAAEIQEVVQRTFTPENRTVAVLVREEE